MKKKILNPNHEGGWDFCFKSVLLFMKYILSFVLVLIFFVRLFYFVVSDE